MSLFYKIIEDGNHEFLVSRVQEEEGQEDIETFYSETESDSSPLTFSNGFVEINIVLAKRFISYYEAKQFLDVYTSNEEYKANKTKILSQNIYHKQ